MKVADFLGSWTGTWGACNLLSYLVLCIQVVDAAKVNLV